MTNPSKKRGTLWETAIVEFLKAHGWTHVERRGLAGNADRGDIAGIPGVVIEAKNSNRIVLAGWLDETTAEAANDNANVGALWIKRRGRTDPGAGYVVLSGDGFVQLLKDAGY